MQLREIHIDRFGAAYDLKITGLKPGVNVLYGPNEKGKTTLIQFIRRVLFGFQSKKNENSYDSGDSGLGGRLVVETSRGETAVVYRKKGPRGGPVTVSFGDEVLEGASAIEQVAGQATPDLFRNIYAFTLDELQGLDTLEVDKVKGRIYGAGLGLGGVSLAEVMKTLDDQRGQLFKGRGTQPRLNGLQQEYERLNTELNAMKESLPEYDRINLEAGRLREKSGEWREAIRRDEELLQGLTLRHELYPVFLSMEEARQGLEALGPRIQFNESVFESMEKLVEEKKGLERRMQEEAGSLHSLEVKLQGLEVPRTFLEKTGEMEALRQSVEQVRSAMADVVARRNEYGQAVDQVQADIAALDPDWDEARVRAFTFTEAELAEVEQMARTLAELGQKDRDARAKLEFHREQKAAEGSGRPRIPEWLNMFVYGFSGGGLILLLAGLSVSETGMMLGGLALMAGAGLLFFNLRKRAVDFETGDGMEQKLEADQAQAQDAHDKAMAQWWDWLGQRGLRQGLTPQKIDSLWSRIRQIKTRIADQAALQRRIEGMEQIVRRAEELVADLGRSCPGFSPGQDLAANMTLLIREWDAVRGSEQEMRQLTEQIRDVEGRVARLKEQAGVNGKALDALFREAEVHSEEALREKFERYREQQALEKARQLAERRIQERVGKGGDYKRFIESLHEARPDELALELERVRQSLESNQQAREVFLGEIGGLEEKAKSLVSGEALRDTRARLETTRAALNRYSRDWAVLTLARTLLTRAKKRYETERQPAVIKSAETCFASVTAGVYDKIIKPLDTDDLHIRDTGGRTKGVLEMSRGTREQLYLCLRLGLIEEYESRAEPLPVIMDDVFVNFDDDRKPRIVELLRQFSEDRQVLMLTCHRQTRDLCLEHGAHAVEW